MAFGPQPLVAGIFYGIQLAVVAIISHALHRAGSKSPGNPRVRPVPWVMSAVSFVAMRALSASFRLVVLDAAQPLSLCSCLR